jgi:hypothetical protein
MDLCLPRWRRLEVDWPTWLAKLVASLTEFDMPYESESRRRSEVQTSPGT